MLPNSLADTLFFFTLSIIEHRWTEWPFQDLPDCSFDTLAQMSRLIPFFLDFFNLKVHG